MHQPPVRFTYRLLSYLISTIIAGQPLLPAVGAVITPQNGAGMDKAANGVPVVNIATPNGAGISHNRFTDYNVGKEGLILNNATAKLNPTQLGGLIQNNPNLKAGGEAKGIINEVTGGNRSLLQGYTEVAGKAANVMVANPYGITCDGCGFINTPHATLTTGRPVMNADGSLQALEVTEGSITINGAGLDGTRSDAVSIIARATEVNAALHAKDLTVTAGANRVTADGRVRALKGEGDVPKVAVDTGALGGMYARRIHLTSTESGVGVNLGNLYARDGDITLDASGRLTVNNSLATGAVTAKGQGVTLTGDHKAGGNLSVSSRRDIVLSNGTLNSDKDLSLTAGGRITQQNEKLTAGRDVTLAAKNITQDTASQINAARDIVTVASDTLTTQGQITAGQNLTASATTLTQDGILLAKGHAGLDAGTLNNSGAVQGASLTLGSTTLSNSGSLLSGSRLTVNTHEFNQSGRTGAKGKVDIMASGKLTSTGLLVSDDALVLKAQDVTQNGVLSGGKGLTVSAQTLSSGKKSVTHSDAAMTLNVTTVALDGETSAGDTLRVQADKLSTAAGAQLQSGKNLSINARDARLAGTQAAQQTMVVNASEKLTHSGKSSAPSLSLSAPELTSSGVLVGSALNTQSQTLTNSGLLQGEASLTVNTQRLDNQQNGTLYSAADLMLDIPDIRNSGLITGDNGLMLNAVSLSNPGKIIADTLSVRATTLDGDGLLQGAGALALAGDTLSQGSNGRWLTAGDLTLRGKTLHTAGTTQGQNLTVQADNWANSGSVLATGNLTASATGQLTSTGDIMSQGDTTLKAATTDNRGSLLSAGTLSLDGNSLDNRGTVQGNHVTIRQNSVTNSGTLTGIAALTLAARMASPQPALMNNGGSLLTSGDLTITAGSITSSGHWQGKRVLITADSLANSGAIQAADSLTARLTGELVSTAGSKVTSNGEMALSALNLSNSGQWIAKNLTLKANSLTSAGDITGVDTLTLTVNQTLNNQANGKLLSAGVLTLKADSVTNDGQLQGNVTTITAGQLTNGGHLQGETLTLAASGGVNNRSGGVLMSRNALNVSTATLSNQGTIQGGGGVSLNATDRLQNDGKILSGSNLTLTAQVLANTGSGLVQAATLLLDVVNTVNGGRVLATGSADVKGTTLNNTGTLQGADLLVNYHTFSNSGTLLGTSGLGVKGSSLLQNGTGRLYSAGNLLLDAQDFSGQGQVVATGDVTLKLIAALTNHGTLAAGKTLSVTSQNAITNGGVMQGDAMVLGAGEAFTNNGTLTAGKGNSVFSAQRLFLNAPGSLQGGGDVSLNSRSDITISGFTGTAGSLTMNVAGTATGNISVNAGRDVALTTATESDYHYLETKKKSGGFLSKKTTHTISEDSATREAGSLLSGSRVTVNAGDNLTVESSDVVADRDVSLAAGNHVDVLAAINTDTSWRFKETKKSGLMGTGGIGFTIGSSKTTHDRREAGTTQSQSASTIGSTAGNVSITAGKQAHISGSDVIANRDISITGDSVVVDPGHDRRTVDEKFEQKKSGLTVALSGTVGSAINNAVTSAQETKESSDSRLKALQATKTALSGVQAGQAATMASATGDPNAMGVSLSLTTQKSKSQQHSESDTVSGSTLNAGNNLSVVATGKNRGDNRGDIVIAGSQLKAGGNTSLDAANDILLSGAANTQKTTGRNSSSGGGVGVSIGAGGNGAGISVFAGVNAAKGSEKGNGTEWTETTTDSGKTVTINSGRDTVLNGAQVNGNRIIADVGHDLLISSQQDTSKYDSKQTSVAAGGSFTFGSMTGSGYIAASRDKMKSRFDSVAEQTGMFAGDGGFDITVGRHTQLDGAVIASTATPDKNHLDTGTLGFSDLHNEADYKVSHSGISLSGGGSFGDKFQGNMPGGMISAGGHSGHAEGTTQAAVAEGTITIRDRDNQKQNLANLSRDPVHANDSISPIFDKEKEQRRLQTVGLISDIGSQVADIARTQGELNALKAAQDKYGPVPADATEEQRQAYLAKLRDTPEYKKEQEKYGTGSEIQRGIQAATAALQGLAGGNLAGALAGASAPELAHLLKSTEKDPAVNAIAHAILGGAVAAMQGNNVAAGAAGAATGELAARAIAGMLYPGVKQSDLSEEQKQTISTLATVSAGLAGGLTGNSTASAAVGAQSGKNAVENNYLSEEQSLTFDKELSECRNSGRDCQNVIDKWKKISDEQSAEIDQKLKDNPLEAQVIDKEVAKGGYDMAQRPGWLGNIGVEVMTSDEAKAYVQQWNGRDLTKIDVNSPEWTKFAVFASDPENQAMLVSGGLLVKDITKAAISFMSRNTATATVNASEVGMQWGQGNMKQGMPWEDYVGKSLPADARLPKNFKTFDYYDGATKTATSVKSMDTQTMAKLANPNQVYSSIKGNIDAAAKFKEYALSGRELTSSMISNREIQLAIPADTTKTQWAEINRAIEYGKSQGVKVTVTQVK